MDDERTQHGKAERMSMGMVDLKSEFISSLSEDMTKSVLLHMYIIISTKMKNRYSPPHLPFLGIKWCVKPSHSQQRTSLGMCPSSLIFKKKLQMHVDGH